MGRVLINEIAIDYVAGSPTVLPRAEMRVLDPGGAPVVLFQAETGSATEPNPFRANIDGRFTFWVEDTIRFVDVVFFNGKSAPTQRFSVNAGVTSNSISELESDVRELAAFVGFDFGEGEPVPAGAPGLTTDFVGVPEARGVRFSWTIAPDNGSPLIRQSISFSTTQQQTVSLFPDATEYLIQTNAQGISVQPTIIAFNALGPSEPVTADPVVTWRAPEPVTGLTVARQGVGFFDLTFTPAVSPDTPVTSYTGTITQSQGDGATTSFTLPGDSTSLRVESDGALVEIIANNLAGESAPASITGTAAAAPSRSAPLIVEAIAGGIRVTNPGLPADNGSPITGGIITVAQ